MPRIPALDGIDRLVGVLDALATTPTSGRDLPVTAIDAGTGPAAEEFVLGYQQRLLDDLQAGVIPHALLDAGLAAAAERAPEPDVDLLDRIAERWQNTMPRRSGELKLPLYRICRDVLDAPVGLGQPGLQRDELAEHLTARWQRRTPALRLLRGVLDLREAGGIAQAAAVILGILLGEPLKWLYRTRLNTTRRLRWYTEQVSRAGQPSSGFIAAAVHLGAHGMLRDSAALRQKLLLEALGRDLAAAARRRLLSPRRRRRVWPFVLLAASPGGPALRLLNGWLELTARVKGLPVLVVAAQPGLAQDPPVAPRAAAEEIARSLHPVPRTGPVRRAAQLIGVRIPAGPELGAVRDWLDTNVGIRPRRVGWTSAHAGWLIVVALLAGTAGAGAAAYPLIRPCQHLWVADGERVGVDTAEEGCYFTPDDKGSLLHRLQDTIYEQNAAAVASGRYRTVVFLAPLTTDPGDSQQLVPAGVLQLAGAVKAQEDTNDSASFGSHPLRIRLIVANSGYEFGQGPRVAAELTELAAEDPTISAVIGISQSREESIDALSRIPDSLAVIGANTTGNFMTDRLPRYFATQPPNSALAAAIVSEVARRGFGSAMIVADDHDGYSWELHNYLAAELRKAKKKPVPQPFPFRAGTDAELATVTSRLPELAQQVCSLTRQGGVTIYAGRGDYLPKLLDHVQQTCVSDGAIASVPVLAGDITPLVEYEGTPQYARVNTFPGIDLKYTSFSANSNAELLTGSDALRAAAAAVNQAAQVTGVDSVRASNVLQRLNAGITVDGGRDHRGFSISPVTRLPVNRSTLYICTPAVTGVGSRECHRP
jgi:hypothetical protein